MNSGHLISQVQNIMEIEFIQQALFELVTKEKPFKNLLVVNYQDKFLSLSNKDYYIFLMPVVSLGIIDEVLEYSEYIFNRQIYFVVLEDQQSHKKLEDFIFVQTSDVIVRAIHNGIDSNNLYLRLLTDAFKSTQIKL